jgi:mannose-1-phosphate guanylyltransferase
MKAFLLAAGKGTRLGALAQHTPKCLIDIGGKPLLRIWFEKLEESGVDSVLVNTHHLADSVERYVKETPVSGLDVVLSHEPSLLGTAGTVADNRGFVDGDDAFLIVYADNLADMALRSLIQFHREHVSEFTLALFETPEPSQSGIVVCDTIGRVLAFQEKPCQPQGRWANAGLYVAGPSLFDHIPAKRPCDFGYDVLPRLVGRMYGCPVRGFFSDIGTPERLARARKHFHGEHGET